MTRLLPSVLTERDLPIAELTAARLDGELFAIDWAFAPTDEIEQPWHRATALRMGLHDRLIAERLSAAWVWGAAPRPPLRHELCASVGARVSRNAYAWCIVREVVIEPSETVLIGGLAVTTPLRTAVDLLRFTCEFNEHVRGVVVALMRIGGFSKEHCVEQLDARRNLPNKRLAARRLAWCVAPAAYTNLPQ